MFCIFDYTICHENGSSDKVSVKAISEKEADGIALLKAGKNDILIPNGLIEFVCR